jgi:GMP synthase-like glutamine amidotransferase
MQRMKLCILENDVVDPAVSTTYGSYGAMVDRLLRSVGASWSTEIFCTSLGQFPASYETYDAVLLTGSRADSFSQEAWVVQLREHVNYLLQIQKKLLGICFGHQLIALCLGAPVGRAPQGWGLGRMTYQWHATEWITHTDSAHLKNSLQVALLASHQDQVFALPSGANLLASSDFCPVAAFTVGRHVFCVQPHPEFVADYSAYLLDKRRATLAEDHYAASRSSLADGHDGLHVARMMIAFIESTID